MTGVVLNPGTGAVRRTSRRWADGNIRALVREIVPGAKVTGGLADGNGRWRYRVRIGKRVAEVWMPGAPRKAVVDDKSPWAPRIYVDGWSWYWRFAVGALADALGLVPAAMTGTLKDKHGREFDASAAFADARCPDCKADA